MESEVVKHKLNVWIYTEKEDNGIAKSHKLAFNGAEYKSSYIRVVEIWVYTMHCQLEHYKLVNSVFYICPIEIAIAMDKKGIDHVEAKLAHLGYTVKDGHHYTYDSVTKIKSNLWGLPNSIGDLNVTKLEGKLSWKYSPFMMGLMHQALAK